MTVVFVETGTSVMISFSSYTERFMSKPRNVDVHMFLSRRSRSDRGNEALVA